MKGSWEMIGISFVQVSKAALDMELGSPSRGWSFCSGCRGSAEVAPKGGLKTSLGLNLLEAVSLQQLLV